MRLSVVVIALLLPLFLVQSAKAASWATNGSMNTARSWHTMTLLPNGKVLVVGGHGGTNSPLSKAELYDPTTGKWTTTAPMLTGRTTHTATLLPNGKVLIAGGAHGKPPNNTHLNSAELYDPATETWKPTGGMKTNRSAHTATLLANGQVLVAGGYDDNTTYGSIYLSGAELYDPSTGTWTDTGPLNVERHSHTATLLSNGQVLVAGGSNSEGDGHVSSVEVYNPLTGIWTGTDSLKTPRYFHTATLLHEGRVLVAGGQYRNYPVDSYAAGFELYDPVGGIWTTNGALKVARQLHSATRLPDGQVLFAGGLGSGGYLASVELFNPTNGTSTVISNLNIPRRSHPTVLLSDGTVFIAGGLGTNFTPLASTERYDPSNGTWTSANAIIVGRASHTATMLPHGKVLLTGGASTGSVATSSVELYDPATGTNRPTASLLLPRSYHTATLLPNGKVLVAGGGYSLGLPTVVRSTTLFDPTNETWTATADMKDARKSHSATLLRNGKVLVAGGFTGTPGAFYASAELYDPVSKKWITTGSMNVARCYHTATLLTNGMVLVVGEPVTGNRTELYNPTSGRWTMTGSLVHGRSTPTAILLANGKVLVAGGHDGISSTSRAELYDPTSGMWTTTGSMTIARNYHAATMLSNGKVLVTGEISAANRAELYDPATGKWTAVKPLAEGRYGQTATLLRDGMVLVAGGYNGVMIGSQELYDPGLGFSAPLQPQIISVTSPLKLGGNLAVTGARFRGVSGASGGNTQDSSSDHPLVQLRSIESGQTMFQQITNWSPSSFTSLPVWNFPPGWAMATVFVNGIPSTSSIVSITVPIPTATKLTNPTRLTDGVFQLAFTNAPGAVFGALATTNLSLPLSNWTALGGVTEVSPGQFQFSDPQAVTNRQRFYRLRAP